MDDGCIDAQDLNVGDCFVEDRYPEKYRVTSVTEYGVKAVDIASGEEVDFGYTSAAYAPVLIRIEDPDARTSG